VRSNRVKIIYECECKCLKYPTEYIPIHLGEQNKYIYPYITWAVFLRHAKVASGVLNKTKKRKKITTTTTTTTTTCETYFFECFSVCLPPTTTKPPQQKNFGRFFGFPLELCLCLPCCGFHAN